MRISSKFLSNFWPIILYELVNIFSQDYEHCNTEKLDLLLNCCKLVLILALKGIDDFHWHRWMFLVEVMENQQISTFTPLLNQFKHNSNCDILSLLSLNHVKKLDDILPGIQLLKTRPESMGNLKSIEVEDVIFNVLCE